mmetsp:Transcript_117955/g.334491  ORF Transcript_117955/g.334491 Transcript_117955/m.334491 type:complete len:239 (+) Transcript_117955:424-1140(+)
MGEARARARARAWPSGAGGRRGPRWRRGGRARGARGPRRLRGGAQGARPPGCAGAGGEARQAPGPGARGRGGPRGRPRPPGRARRGQRGRGQDRLHRGRRERDRERDRLRARSAAEDRDGEHVWLEHCPVHGPRQVPHAPADNDADRVQHTDAEATAPAEAGPGALPRRQERTAGPGEEPVHGAAVLGVRGEPPGCAAASLRADPRFHISVPCAAEPGGGRQAVGAVPVAPQSGGPRV